MEEAVFRFTIRNPHILLFGRPVSLYILAFIIGIPIIAAVGVLFARRKREDTSFIFRANLLLASLVAIGVLFKEKFTAGGVLLPYLLPSAMIASYGVYWLIACAFKKDRLYLLTQANLAAMLFPVFLQVGCLCVGCCYGKPYDGPFSVVYGPETYCSRPGVPLFPLRILEGAAFLLLFAVAFFLSAKRMNRMYIPLFTSLSISVYYGGMALGSPECNMIDRGNGYIALGLSLFFLAIAVSIITIMIIRRRKTYEKADH